MRAVLVDRLVEPRELRVSETSEPELFPGGLAVDVKAAGCNFFDILMVQGRYQVKPPLPFIPGAEVAGIVSAVGAEVDGSASATASSPPCRTARSPSRSSRRRAPRGGCRRHDVRGRGRAPHRLSDLVRGARAARGDPPGRNAARARGRRRRRPRAVQIGKALGARVLATAGGPEKLAIAKEAGADECIDYRADDWPERVKAATQGRGADVIYDSVGGDVLDQSLKCIAWNGGSS
jgi:NADPH2:quinone reductase